MDESPRGALMLVRFTAAGLICLGVLEPGLFVAECFAQHQSVAIIHTLFLTLPLVVGVTVLVKSRAVADWISEKFD